MMTETAYDRVTRALEAAGIDRPVNDKANWRCPAHEDRQASLSVSRGERGVVLHCHAGCDVEDVLAALRLAKADLFDAPQRNGNGPERSEIVATYDYTDEDGQLLFQVVRLQPKSFRQRRRGDDGGFIWGLGDTRRVIYRLPRVLEAIQRGHIVFVVEGEKDVQALEAKGFTATCNPGGAGKWRDEYARHFQGALVTIVADRDEPGRKHARQVAAALEAVAADVTVLEPAEGKDVADHLAAGLTLEQLLPIAEEDDNPDAQLKILTAAELVRRVESAPPTTWLVKPLWPADAYGVLAAEQKAGKTWANLDLVVSVASGTPWMGIYDIERPGPALCFLGEGGERKMKRRLDAVCEARNLSLRDLPIRLCFRVPHLTALVHLGEIATELEAHKPVLVVVDPLYLAARGAKGSQLYEMGEHLEAVQQICQQRDAALVIVHHWNKTGEGKGAKRMTGVGPGEWGRVLVSVSVKEKRTDPTTRMTKAKLEWEFEGDEIPDTRLVVERRVWSDDPDDLASPLHYTVEEVTDSGGQQADGGTWDGPTECMAAVEHLLSEHPDTEFSKSSLEEQLRIRGLGFRTKTVSQAAERLALEDRVAVRIGKRNARMFSAIRDNKGPEGMLDEAF